jgi:hypothetical protein
LMRRPGRDAATPHFVQDDVSVEPLFDVLFRDLLRPYPQCQRFLV